MAAESSYTVARVAQELELPGLDPQIAWLSTHKVERQRAFAAHNVPAPKYAGASSVQEAVKKAEKIGWPVVVKPADSAGSRGVRKVNDAKEMAAAISEIRNVSNQQEFLIESFLQGSEHSIEGIVVDGEIIWTAFSDRNYDKKEIYAPYFLEDGDTMPTMLDADMEAKARNAANVAVQALGVNWGPVKGDILIDETGPKVLEMATRLSGDYFCYVTTPLHNGINLLEAVMDLSLGLPINREKLKPVFNRGVALRYLWPKPGIVKKIYGIEEARAMKGIHFVKWEPRWKDLSVGTKITAARSMGERVGSVMAYAETRDDAVRIAEKAVDMIKIATEKEKY